MSSWWLGVQPLRGKCTPKCTPSVAFGASSPLRESDSLRFVRRFAPTNRVRCHPDGGAEELFPQKRSFSFEKRPFFSCFTGFGDTGVSGSGFGTVWWG